MPTSQETYETYSTQLQLTWATECKK